MFVMFYRKIVRILQEVFIVNVNWDISPALMHQLMYVLILTSVVLHHLPANITKTVSITWDPLFVNVKTDSYAKRILV